MVDIYILRLKYQKYYVGKTNSLISRINEHFNSEGSKWTKKYKPLELVETIKNCDDFDEDKYTLKYMVKYGMDNVRGGSFSRINLSSENKITLKQMINGATDKCFSCGKTGHFTNKCENQESTCDKILTILSTCLNSMIECDSDSDSDEYDFELDLLLDEV
jgi:predicted GIY-YIG superfamily endonuclease